MATKTLIEYARLQATKSYIEMATQYGCILVHKGKIVSIGNNKRKGTQSSKIRDCCYEPNKYTIHAEQDCIRKCPKKIISNCTMILVKITHLDNVAPCDMCANLISKYRIKKVLCYSCN